MASKARPMLTPCAAATSFTLASVSDSTTPRARLDAPSRASSRVDLDDFTRSRAFPRIPASTRAITHAPETSAFKSAPTITRRTMRSRQVNRGFQHITRTKRPKGSRGCRAGLAGLRAREVFRRRGSARFTRGGGRVARQGHGGGGKIAGEKSGGTSRDFCGGNFSFGALDFARRRAGNA